MGLVIIEIKEEHLKLLKNLSWNITDDNYIISKDDNDGLPFGGDNLYEGIDLILNGKPADFDPLNSEEPPTYTEEQKAEWMKLYKELPLVLEVCLSLQTFKVGKYVAKYHDRVWKEAKPKSGF
jgi:hypothetical protein